MLPEPVVELLDQLVMALLRSHVENSVPFRTHFEYVALSMANNNA